MHNTITNSIVSSVLNIFINITICRQDIHTIFLPFGGQHKFIVYFQHRTTITLLSNMYFEALIMSLLQIFLFHFTLYICTHFYWFNRVVTNCQCCQSLPTGEYPHIPYTWIRILLLLYTIWIQYFPCISIQFNTTLFGSNKCFYRKHWFSPWD